MTPQPSLKIVVEGITDAQLVRAILGDEVAKKTHIYAAQGLASLETIARNVLFHEGGPVLLVMDSDTLNPQLTAELESLSIAAMNSPVTSGIQFPVEIKSDGPLFKVFAFVPEIEAVFFESPKVLDRLLGKKPPEEKIKEGHLVPKQVLSELLANGKTQADYQGLLSQLDPQSRHALAAGTQAGRFKAMAESLLADAA